MKANGIRRSKRRRVTGDRPAAKRSTVASSMARKAAASRRNVGAAIRARTYTAKTDAPPQRLILTLQDYIDYLVQHLSRHEDVVIPKQFVGIPTLGEWLHTEECWCSGKPWCLSACRDHNMRRLGLPTDAERDVEEAKAPAAVDPKGGATHD